MPPEPTIIEEGYDIADRKEKVKVLRNGEICLTDRNLSVILFRQNALYNGSHVHFPREVIFCPVYSYGSLDNLLVDIDPYDRHDIRKLIPK